MQKRIHVFLEGSTGDDGPKSPLTDDSKSAISSGVMRHPLAHGKLTAESALGSKVLKEIEKNHGKKSITQIALNWFISKYDFVFPIPRASNPDHVRENAGAMGWRMTPDEIALLESSVSGDLGPSSPVDPSRKT